MATNNVVLAGNSTAQYQSLYIELNIKSQDTTKLTTTFSYKAWIIGNASGASGSTSNGSYILSNAYSKSASGQSWSWNSTTSQIIAQGEFTKTHASDGILSAQTLTAKATVPTYVGTLTATVSVSVTAPKIAVDRPSNYTGPTSLTLVNSYNLTVDQSSGYTHDFYYNISGGVEIAKDVVSSISWTPSISIANQIIESVQTKGLIVVVTKKNGVVVGQTQKEVTFVVPSTIVPNLTIDSVIDTATAQFTKFGFYIQGKSYPKVASTATGQYGASIVSTVVEYDGRKYTGSNVAIGVTGISGTRSIKVTAKDSRGRIKTATLDIKVVEYSTPTITLLKAERSNADGTSNPTGANIRVDYLLTISPLETKNSNSAKIRYKKQSDSTFYERLVTITNYQASGSMVLTGIDTNSRYDVYLDAYDYFTKTTAYQAVSTAEVIFDVWGGDGVGITFGTVAQGPGFFIGLNNLDVETGSNSNGTWVKLGNGVLIQYGRKADVSFALTYPFGAMFRNLSGVGEITLPIPFKDNNYDITIQLGTTSVDVPEADVIGVYRSISYSATAARVYLLSMKSQTVVLSYKYIAIGRWK